jgi:hypothetical protein
MGQFGTYEIVSYTVNHPTEGLITKQKIIYYNNQNQIETEEYYFGYVREGYTQKN